VDDHLIHRFLFELVGVTDSFTHHLYLLWLSYIFYHEKCRVYSGRINLGQAIAVESWYAWTIIDGNRIAEVSTNFRPLLELEFAIDTCLSMCQMSLRWKSPGEFFVPLVSDQKHAGMTVVSLVFR
jgi:hypothetical protein